MFDISEKTVKEIHECLDIAGRSQRDVPYDLKIQNREKMRELKTLLENSYNIKPKK